MAHTKSGSSFRRKLFMGLFISPALLLILAFAYWPIITTLNYSLNSWNGISKEMTWVGFSNYLRLFEDPNFITRLRTIYINCDIINNSIAFILYYRLSCFI